MKLDAILHVPMSEYCHGLDEKHIVYRMRSAKDDLKRVTLYYGDTACRVTPIIFTPVPMELVASDLLHDYWQAIVDSPYNRVYYYFELDDGIETNLFFAEQSIDAADFAGRITDMLMRYRVQTVPAQLNLLDSHDVSRFLSLCNGDSTKYKLAILFMMTFVGMPTVFYGDELGIQGILEEEYRHPMPWNGGNTELRAFFKKAIAMRQKFATLRRGNFRMVSAESGSGLLVYTRKLEDEIITVCINHGEDCAELPEIKGSLYWSGGLNDRTLEASGFAVFSSCEA